MNKKTITPIILSAFVFPGLGQIYNKQYGKGLIIILGSIAITIFLLVVLAFVVLQGISNPQALPTEPLQMYLYADKLKDDIMRDIKGDLIVFTCVFVPLWIYGIIDAWVFYLKKSS